MDDFGDLAVGADLTVKKKWSDKGEMVGWVRGGEGRKDTGRRGIRVTRGVKKRENRRTLPSGIRLTIPYTFRLNSSLTTAPCTFPSSAASSSDIRSWSCSSVGSGERDGRGEEARVRVREVRVAGMARTEWRLERLEGKDRKWGGGEGRREKL